MNLYLTSSNNTKRKRGRVSRAISMHSFAHHVFVILKVGLLFARFLVLGHPSRMKDFVTPRTGTRGTNTHLMNADANVSGMFERLL